MTKGNHWKLTVKEMGLRKLMTTDENRDQTPEIGRKRAARQCATVRSSSGIWRSAVKSSLEGACTCKGT